jgi:hypothetical protein
LASELLALGWTSHQTCDRHFVCKLYCRHLCFVKNLFERHGGATAVASCVKCLRTDGGAWTMAPSKFAPIMTVLYVSRTNMTRFHQRRVLTVARTYRSILRFLLTLSLHANVFLILCIQIQKNLTATISQGKGITCFIRPVNDPTKRLLESLCLSIEKFVYKLFKAREKCKSTIYVRTG